jgi:hypothetical protein
MKSKTNVLLCILLGFFLVACGGGGGGGSSDDPGGAPGARKLLSKIVKDGREVVSYRYDSFNRVTERIEGNNTQTIEYEGNDYRPSLVRNVGPAATYPYTRYSYGEASYGGALTKYYQIQDLDSNRNPVFPGYYVRHYLNSVDRVFAVGVPGLEFVELFSYDSRGNLTKVTVAQAGWGNDETWEFTYDNQKGAVSETTTPYWWWSGTMGPNNLTSIAYTERRLGVEVNKLRRTLNYTYDSDGYPIRCTGNGDEIVGAYGAAEGTFEYVLAH